MTERKTHFVGYESECFLTLLFSPLNMFDTTHTSFIFENYFQNHERVSYLVEQCIEELYEKYTNFGAIYQSLYSQILQRIRGMDAYTRIVC